jgi:hypothetical protein
MRNAFVTENVNARNHGTPNHVPSPEYHQLIRDIATALRTRPELADVLRGVLQAEHGVTERDTDVLQAFQERLTIQSEVSRNIMAFTESINERLKALEQPEAYATRTVTRTYCSRS